MANSIKYSTGSESESLRKGNFHIGTGAVGKGPTNVTGFYNGVTPPSGGYTIYIYNSSQPGDLSYHTASNDSELISFTNSLAGQSYTTAQECFDYYYGQTDKVLVNQDYPADYPYIVMDGLVLNLDAGITQSYPGSGTAWTDVNGLGPKNNGTLTNGPTFNSGNGGSIVFDGTNDYVQTSLLFNKDDFTYGCWFNRSGQGSPGVENNLIDSYESTSTEWARLNVHNGNHAFHIDNDNLKVILQGSSVTLNTWYYSVGVWTKSTGNMKLYVNGQLNAQTTHSKRTTITAVNPERIGDITANNISEFFNGKIAVAQVYNKALSADEVLQNYNAQKGRFGL